MTEAFSEEWKMKTVGIATDGASVMRGKNTGAVTRLLEETNRPYIQTVHCSAHRLELAFKDAIKELPLWKRAEALLLGVYLFYRRSPLNRSNLILSFEMEGPWIRTQSDVLPLQYHQLQVMSPCVFQIWLSLSHQEWEAPDGHAARALKNLLTSYRPLVEHLKQATSNDSARVQLIDKLTQSLSDRFVVDSQLSEACCITNMNIWPPILKEGFGDEHIAALVTTFRPALKAAGVDSWQVEPEWVRLKDTICRLYPERPAELTWALLNSQLKGSGEYSNILSLVDLVLTLPASSAEAERGFSAMKLVKSDWRSRLKDNHLTDLLMILLESPEVMSFDPVPAIHLWNTGSARGRRPDFIESQSTTAADKWKNHELELDEQMLAEIEQMAQKILSSVPTVD